MVTAINLEVFARGVGIEAFARPEPVAGEPRRERPAAAGDHGWWVPTVDPGDAVGELADLYPGPHFPHVQRSLSLVPDELRGVSELSAAEYLPYGLVPDPAADAGRVLARPQMELVAARVSALNDCFY